MAQSISLATTGEVEPGVVQTLESDLTEATSLRVVAGPDELLLLLTGADPYAGSCTGLLL